MSERVAVVVGAGGDLGLATAVVLADAGFSVCASGIAGVISPRAETRSA